MRALIVDDERLARSELKRLLGVSSDVEVVGEAANIAEARKKVAQQRPDVMFLDIEMPGGTAFDLLDSLDWVPHVVFTTAYPQHAVRAFDVNAVDYLLKPIDPVRLAKAINRVQKVKPQDASHSPPPERLFVRDGERCWFIEIAQIPLIVSEGNFARLCIAGHEPTISRPLNRLTQQLEPANFFRANRSQLVNLAWVTSVEPGPVGRLVFILRDGRQVELSRRQAHRFRERNTL